MTEPDPLAPSLPGLDLDHLVDVGRGPAPRLQLVAEAQIRALRDAGKLNAGHALLVGLILDLARTVGMGANAGKAAGVAMASRQLLDAMAQLPALVEDEHEANEWADVVRALSPAAGDEDDEQVDEQ